MRENIPIGLRQILEVYRLVQWSGYERQDAVRQIAQAHRVASTTISSALTRNIGITTAQLDDYMERGKEDVFCKHLVRHFSAYQNDIEGFFDSFRETTESAKNDPARFFRAYFPDEIKKALNDLLLDEVKKHLSQWINRTDIPEDLKHEFAILRKKLGGD